MRYFRFGYLLIILFLVILWFLWLDIDPPYFFKGYSQAHLTDPYHLTFFARNAVLFDDWNPYDYHRWDIFKYSAVSGVSYLFFALFGVSRVTANLTAVFLSLGGLGLFLLGLRKLRPGREIVLTCFLLLASSMIYFYGRLPFLETGLIFISGLLFFVFVNYHDRYWGQISSGVLIALAALAGKLFALILIGPVILTLYYRYRYRAVVPILMSTGGLALGVALYVFLFYDGSLTIMKQYYLEQTTGMYGAPRGFESLKMFFLWLVTYGSTSGFFGLSPFFVAISSLGLIMAAFTIPFRKEYVKEYLPLIFCILWVICGIAGLMPFNYRPLRYALFLFLPMASLGAYAANLVFKRKPKISFSLKPFPLILTLMVLWYLLTQIYICFSPHLKEIEWGDKIMPYSLIISLLITAAIYWFLRRNRERSCGKMGGGLAALLILGMLLIQGNLFYKGLAVPGRSLREVSIELGQILDKNAVLTGPYTPAYTIDNNLKGIIYHFGLPNTEDSLFQKFPISHVVTERPNWDRALKDFPILVNARQEAIMVTRDFVTSLFRLQVARVPLSDFERALMLLEGGQADRAVLMLESILRQYPDNFLVQKALADACNVAGFTTKYLNIIDSIAEKYPDSYRAIVFCGRSYRFLFEKTGDEKYRDKAELFFEKVYQIMPELKM